jgi:hypothetical protein
VWIMGRLLYATKRQDGGVAVQVGISIITVR